MPQTFLNKKILFTLTVTGLLTKVAQLQLFAQNDYPVTPEQYFVLSIIDESGEIYQRQVCEIAFKDRPNMTRIINILEEKGLVKRVPDVNKRKVNKIQITEKGKELHAMIKPSMIQLRDDAVKDIKTEELESCLNVMGQILDNLEKTTKLHT